MKVLISEIQYRFICENLEKEVEERSRSFAFTRKKRLFSKPERMSNPLRYRFVDRLEEENDGQQKDNKKRMKIGLTQSQIERLILLNKDDKFLTCKNCRKKFTQTTHKKKKSLPICPYCGTHNN